MVRISTLLKTAIALQSIVHNMGKSLAKLPPVDESFRMRCFHDHEVAFDLNMRMHMPVLAIMSM